MLLLSFAVFSLSDCCMCSWKINLHIHIPRNTGSCMLYTWISIAYSLLHGTCMVILTYMEPDGRKDKMSNVWCTLRARVWRLKYGTHLWSGLIQACILSATHAGDRVTLCISTRGWHNVVLTVTTWGYTGNWLRERVHITCMILIHENCVLSYVH